MSTNTKGLLTRQRQPKASAHARRQRYQALTVDMHPRFTGDQLLDVLIRFKPHEGDKFPIAIHNRLPALIREERVNTTIRKRSLDEIMTYFELWWPGQQVFYLKMTHEGLICSDIFPYGTRGKAHSKMYMNLGANFLLERVGH